MMKYIVRSTLLALATLGAASVRHAMAGVVPAAVEMTGSSVTTTVLPDQSTVVKFLADGTFTVPAGATGRILLVGGGGGGGYDCSGGGGAGGMLEASNVVFSAGTYAVTVGAGGAGGASTKSRGGNGGDTVLVAPNGAETRAYGGGGGGAWDTNKAGATGGSGGGGTNGGAGGAGTSGQGNAGGTGTSNGPQGGGGAGAAAVGANNGKGNAHHPDGGAGRACDITGEEVYYAGGGGAGDYSGSATYNYGLGGTGGGGNGAANVAVSGRQSRTDSATGKTLYELECGVDGLGGGGGGGNNTDHVGRPGGSGVLIVRLDPILSGPEPMLSVLDVTDGPESATVRARVVSVGEDASSVAISYAVAESAAALDSATPVVVSTGVMASERVSFSITGLTAGTTYYIRLFAENNLGETCQSEDFECLPYTDAASVTAVGAAREFAVGRDRVAVFNQSSGMMTFTLAERAAVELLLVGGGGGGGSYVGGGGGAGGFLHVETAVLDAGTYTVAVGAGGSGATADQRQGVSGGDTTFSFGGNALYTAHGGGGGGDGWNSSYRNGLAGASGGGAGIAAGTAGASTAAGDERGNAGGANDTAHNTWNLACGGGGAGAPGTHADYAAGVGGKGGDGLPCLITGEEVWYAGGGGAGQNYDAVGGLVFTAGLGGRGGGGMGCRTADNVIDDYERGTDGLGGGGGGGRKEGDSAAGKPRWGAPGGSGTLIVRWHVTPDTTARATVDSVVGSVGGVIVVGSVQLAGADASGATLEMAVGPTGGSLGSYETLGTGLGAGERFTLTLTGLAAGTDFDYAIRVRSGQAAGEILGAATGSFSTFASAPARLASDPAGAVKTTVGTDSVYTFATTNTYTFTVSTRGRARLLMVGGGGAGGTSRGGGGGAGGFIELPAVTLEPGTYTVVVGAGGAVNTAQTGQGGDGEDTVLSFGDTVLYTAHGGGGGGYGNKDAGTVNSRGRAGGSGGGGGPCAPVGGDSTAVSPELGNPGGKGSGQAADKFDSAAAGGGGAGGAGSDGYWSNVASGPERRQGGTGGPGVASDITGETLYYAAGGGGSVWYDNNGGYKGLGGSGVGGDGGGYTDEVCQNITAPTAGLDGTGSGGGGGFQYDKCSDAARRGAAGGCGAFILRLAADDSADLPDAVIETLALEATTVNAVLALRNTGSEPTADLSLAYGMAADTLDLSAPIATGAERGLHSATVSGLEPGRTWFFAPVASNAGGAFTGAVQSVTLPAAGALPAGDGSFGLWQASCLATAATFSDVFTNATFWAEAQSSNIVSGALAADTRDLLFEDPATGRTYVWGSTPVFYAYHGWIYLEGGKTVVFGSRYADSVFVAVDGRTLIAVCKSQKTDAFGSIQTEESGWHEIDVRVGHHTSTFGPDGNGTSSWTSFGVAFNENGSISPMPESGWTRLLDPGDGSLLRPSRPEMRTLSLTSAAASGGTLSLGAVVGSGENPAHAWLVYGDEDAGTAVTNGWSHVVNLGEVAASNEAENLAAQVAGWGSAAKVARLVLETDGLLAWTEPVTYTATALPSVFDVLVSDYALGDRATFCATVFGGTAPYTATLLLGADSSSLAAIATTNLDEAGAFSFGTIADLAPGALHCFQVVVTDEHGATARSDVLSFVTPGASRIYDFTDGSTSALWENANPFVNQQRTIVFGGTLSEYGAGETTVRLLRNQVWYGAPSSFAGQKTTVPHDGESLVLSAAGAYTLPVLLDWDLDVTWNWDVSNATETASWGPTADLRDNQNWARYVTVVDATKYTWAGGEGLWTDSGMWSPESDWDDIAGYPRRGSYAVFPAGTSVVSVPDTALTNRFSSLTFTAGANVTIRPAEGATDATLRLQNESFVSSSRNYGFDMKKNTALRFEGEGLFVDFFNSWACYPNDSDTSITFADGVRARIGNGSNNSAWTANGKSRTLFCVTSGAEVTVLGQIFVNGEASQMIIDDAKLLQTYYNGDNSSVCLRGRGLADKATLIIRGANPILQVGKRFVAQSYDSGVNPQYVDFEVPEGGWLEAPIRSNPSNPYKFGQSSTSNYKIILRVPSNSPAVVAGESLDVPLVRWPGGVDANVVTLDPAYLPHPATDSFFQTTDPVTGQITVWAHLVGQADTAAPQASDFRVRSLAQTGAELSFVVIPGSGETAVSVEVLDGKGVAVGTATPSFVATSTYATNLVSVAGLDPATDYTLRVTLDDGSNPAVTADFVFRTIDDWGEGESATADPVVQDGPYTVWTFTDTTPHASFFTVTRAGLAELLVVGGGGSGGAGKNDSTYGGGGGGGGQVLSTNVVLVPGTYAIQVGKGGAKLTARGVGADGGTSAFGDILAIGGGGGGYNSVGNDGASGGGGSNNKAGGAGSAGFAGGMGASNLAGGGGGGAGGAGSNGASTLGGAGGAGVTNAISGYPTVYGAGGGGGSSGSYSAYKGGGAPGAETAGHGAEASLDGRKAASVSAQNATPGFGGGGGGGCASGDGNDSAGYYGGAGGSGTVIVRMRTATAADPAPQVSIKEETVGEANWSATLEIYSLGQGASDVTATLRVARDGSATTNDFSVGSASVIGATTLVATGLAPSADYAGILVLDNGLADGILEIPVAFTTADTAATTVSASSAWVFGQWSGTVAAFQDNLLRGKQPAATIASTGATATEANLARTVNGAEDSYYLYADRQFTWTWDAPVYLTAFRVFYKNNDWRSAVNIASVEALGKDGTWTVISPAAGHYNATWGSNYGYLLPADGAAALWSEPAYGLRFTTDGYCSTDWHNFREVEADGIPVANQPADLSISSLSRTDAGVKALVAFSHELPADATVTAFVAATHGGTDASLWTAATSATAEAGALSQNFSIGATALDGMNYLRFRSDDGNGGVRWSETVYLPDVEILAAIPPIVNFVAVRDATPGSVTLVASLVDAGSGAENERADLYVRYAAQSNDVAAATARLVAGDIPEGETTAVLDGLMPGRLYWAQFVASNEGGDTGASDLFSFTTAPDEIGGGAASEINSWFCDTWSNSSVVPTNNLLRGLIPTVVEGDIAPAGTLSELTDGYIANSSGRWYGPGCGTVLTFELGGVFSLFEFRLYQYWTGNDRKTISVASLEWRDEAGEWHRIAGSPLEFSVGDYNRAFLTPADGAPFLAVGATAFRFTQGAGGTQDTHPIREMELLGVPSGAHRILTVDVASWSAGTLTATVTRPLTNAVGTIHAVSGAGYHGTDAAAWAADGNDAVFGALAADETTVSAGTFTPAAGAAYIRFYEADENGAIVAWSDTIPADAGIVRVVDGGVDADGDTAVLPIRVVSAGTGTLSVSILLADDPDFMNATNIVVANPGIGAFSVPVAVEPGGTYWYRIVAETTDGGFDETPVASFTTRAGSVLARGVSVTGVSHRFATLNGTLETLGAGVTTLEILIGDSPQALEVLDTVVLDRAGAFSIPVTVTGLPRKVYYAFHTVNVAPGGTTWESWSSISANNTFTTADNVTYTWKKEVTEGAWNEPANWIPNVSYYCTGYPDNGSASVMFPNATTNTVHVPGKYRFSGWSLGDNNGTDVTFVGNGADVSGLTGNMMGGGMKNCNLTFAALSITEDNGFEIGQASDFGKGRNTTVTFSDGADAYFKGWLALSGRDMNIAVLDGATLRFSVSNGLANASASGGLRLDNGTVRGHYVYTDYGSANTTNQWFAISGAAPRIELAASFRNSRNEAAYLQNADTSFLFTVPEDGWKNPVIYSEAEEGMFAGMLGDGAGGYVLAIDPNSPIFWTGRIRTVTLVAWKGGIDTNHVTLVEPPKSATLFYSYGWPSVLDEPENVDDLPTGIRAKVPGTGAFRLFLR